MFTLATAPRGCRSIGTKWVQKWTTKESPEVTKAKARLVAKGFGQKPGVDVDQTFAPTPSFPSIRSLIATAVEQGMDLLHMGAEQAIVQSNIDTDIYMRLPPRCGELPGKVVLVHNSVWSQASPANIERDYGLPSEGAWFRAVFCRLMHLSS